MSSFVHLNVHTHYSLQESTIRIPDLADTLIQHGMTGCAITDSANLFGVIEFYTTLQKKGLHPIIGMEAYVADGHRTNRSYSSAGPNASTLVLLCKNEQGYHNLCRLASIGYLEGKHYRPRIDRELLEAYHEGLIALCGGQWGVVGRVWEKEGEPAALEAAKWYANLFAERFYLEVHDHGQEAEAAWNERALQCAKQVSLPLVASNQCRYLESADAYAQYLLQLNGRQKSITSSGVLPFNHDASHQKHLRSADEMANTFVDFPSEVLSNTLVIAERCQFEIAPQKPYLPVHDIQPGYTEAEWFNHLAKKGLQERLETLVKRYEIAPEALAEWEGVYHKRLDYELSVISNMHYEGYFLIVADFIGWAKEHDVRVGPGRGSGAGSLVAYSLDITALDPIYHGLLFERFLNPERVSLPDFDIDFDVEGRDRVIEYVRHKYGDEKVCQISTFGSFGAKAAVRAMARVLDFNYADADRIAKLIPDQLNITLAEAMQMEPELDQLATEGEDREKNLMSTAQTIEGLNANLSTHAAGVIIMSQNIQDVMPVCFSNKAGSGGNQSMYSMKWAEHQGAVKFDFLGLNNLSIIKKATQLINHNQQDTDKLDIDSIPLDNPQVYALLARGDSTGVFQLESNGMRRLMVALNPTHFSDVVALLALYRPGPLESGVADAFIKRKHNQEPAIPIHPKLADLLEETHGLMIYQEQVIEAAQRLAGFTLGEADILRRAMGKKNPEEMAQQRDRFIDGCVARDINKKQAALVFEQIDKFAGYGFNKSHSAAYGLIAYQTAYLKANYPLHFIAALLSSAMDNPDKMASIIADTQESNIALLPPDVNTSGVDFVVEGNAIRFGLNAVRNVGRAAAQALIEVREQEPTKRFADLKAFISQVDLHMVNKRALEALVQCGGLDSLHANRNQLLSGIDAVIHAGTFYQNAESKGQESLLSLLSDKEREAAEMDIELPAVPDFSLSERLEHEKSVAGFYISGHPLLPYKQYVESFATSSRMIREGELKEKEVWIAGVIGMCKIRVTKQKAERFAQLRLEDLYGSMEVMVMPRVYKDCSEQLQEGSVLLMKGRLNLQDQRASIHALSVESLHAHWSEKVASIILNSSSLTDEMLQRLSGTFSKFKGNCPITFKLSTQAHGAVYLNCGLAVSLSIEFMNELWQCVSPSQVHFDFLPIGNGPTSNKRRVSSAA